MVLHSNTGCLSCQGKQSTATAVASSSSLGGSLLLSVFFIVVLMDLSMEDSIKLRRASVVSALCMVGERSCGSTGCLLSCQGEYTCSQRHHYY